MTHIIVTAEERDYLLKYHATFFKGEPEPQDNFWRMYFESPLKDAHILLGWGRMMEMQRRKDGKS